MIFVVLVCADDCSPALQTDDDLAKKWLLSVVIRELGLVRHTASKTLTGGRLRSCESRLRQVQL